MHGPQDRREDPAGASKTIGAEEPAQPAHQHHAAPGAHAAPAHVHAPGAPGPAGPHVGHDAETFRRRFWVCLVLTLPILAYSELIRSALGYTPPAFPGSQLVPLVFGSAVFFYGGSVFLSGARTELATGRPGMMTLVSLAIAVAYVYSVATELGFPGTPLYWELATLIVVMLLGHWIEMRAVGRARGALAGLAELLPDTAEKMVDDRTEMVRVADLRPGDLVLIRPGGRVPADGVVLQGESSVNESMVTGESRPVHKAPGGEVIAGTVNGEGSLRVRVTRVGAETMLAGIMRLVEQAQASRSQAQDLADRAAYWLVLIAIGAGTLTLVAWLALGAPTAFALERTVTVLVIACPHALGLAIPLVVAISTTLAARSGILVRERLALERARDLHVVVFDKTGTLTEGRFGIVGVATAGGLSEEEALALAEAVERDSEHPIARAIRAEAKLRGVPRLSVSGFEAMPGRGVRARVDGHVVEVGGPRLLEALGQPVADALRPAVGRWDEEGKTVVYLVLGGRPEAALTLADVIRPESREGVADLHRMGIRVAMLTGDGEQVARWVAREVGIDEFFAEVLPGQKAEKIRELRQRGPRVAMVGDGINDAPALLTADVGIAIGAGTHVAIESAGIILVRNDPRDVVRVIELSRASYRKMIENLFWATGYNVVAIPLAAGVLAPLGVVLIPAVGALLMSASTVVVAVNAQLLRGLKLRPA